MSPRERWITYGSAAICAIAGGTVAAVSHSTTVQIIGYAVGGLALGAIVLLVFYEIGLSEDRAREEEQRGR